MTKVDLRNGPVPDDYWLMTDVYAYPSYKGVYYAYDKYADEWILYSDFYYGRLAHYNADKYRIDQCFDMWFEHEKAFGR